MDFRPEQTPKLEPESDMTPMVDVTFLLLIFFMVTAAFAMQRSMVVPKPQPKEPVISAIVEEEPADIVVEVDEFNTFHVTADSFEQEAPSEHDLVRVLRQIRERAVGEKPINHMLVKANPEALHEKVVAALDSGAYVGIAEIELLTLD
ncbi:MAG: biopolymer transporter ExbD [Planctomycetaceae bacterium]|nr:biopolymer transporter ExbD [Planctomycetales bacterium]MCB9873410.1 biopolymer transporter ExbD [Planctomycetaceae bacterium]MCB9939083.1 biopolymer transporter ExbD [Planctomycetaceae bacterium]HRX80963.1 biopolymer transporter ExbD [Pirellulaceae bacterium]